jgi:hypothetical protein
LDKHPDLVDLERRYQNVPLGQNDLEAISSHNTFSLFKNEEPGHSIHELAGNPLTVVLGEARSGKTTELRIASASMVENGSVAFFIRIEDLAFSTEHGSDAVRFAIEDHEDFFGPWLESDDIAVFFLDAVDEAKLKNTGDYRRAIKTLQNTLRDQLHRMRLVVSCRVTEWRPRDDIQPLLNLLPALASPKDQDKADGESTIKLVQIMPLNQRRIELLAKHNGLEDYNPLIEAIRTADAFEYAERPGDVIELIDIWAHEARLGTLTDIIRQNITRKLQEDADIYSDVISSEKARFGAERLAAASVLASETSFRFTPREQDPADALPALDPVVLLPDWSRDEIQALLRRPIFDEATYGRVRFHTRTVREYLTTCWFRRRHELGCPTSDIIQVFFVKRYGKTAIIPSLTSVAAWLAPHLPELLNKILTHNPEILPDEGDPQALPVHTRARVLNDMVVRYADRLKSTGFSYNPTGLRRFAHPDLADTIRTILERRDATDDISALLLDLVQVGRLTACVEAALRIAVDNSVPSNVRVDAMLALMECDGVEELRQVYRHILSSQNVSERLYGWALTACYPLAIGASGLILLLTRAPTLTKTTKNHIKDHAERVVEKEEDGLRLRLLAPKLLDLLKQTDRYDKEKRPYWWLFPTLCSAVAGWIKHTGAKNDLDWLCDALDFISAHNDADYHADEAKRKIGEAIATAPAKVRELYLWRAHSAFVKEYGGKDILLHQVINYQDIWRLVPEDIDWLLERIYSEPNRSIRFTAFDAALSLCYINGKLSDRVNELHEVARSFSYLKKHLEQQLTPPKKSPFALRLEMRNWAIELRKQDALLKLQEAVNSNLDKIRSGEDDVLICRMFRKLDNPNGKWTEHETRTLEKDFGRQGAEAFRAGVINFWPTWEPSDEGRLGDEISLIGVACSVADNFDLSSLDKVAAQRLVRLAFKDIQLTDWLPSLLRHHGDAAHDVILGWLETETDQNRELGAHPRTLADIVYADGEILAPFIVPIAQLAQKNMPLAVCSRRYIVRALSGHENRHHLVALAERHFATRDVVHMDDLYWFAIWLQVAAVDALDWLEPKLNALSPEDAEAFVRAFAVMLDIRHSNEATIEGRADYVSVPALTRLIPMVYSYVRPEDDPVRYSSWTPDDRDAAMSFRGDLVASLANIPGEEAYRALLAVRELIPNQFTKDWILYRADQKIGKDAETNWTVTDVIEFERDNEYTPHTADDLFVISMKRIREIRDQFETGDYSLRELFTVKTDESVLQKHVAQRLEELSRGRYSVVREPEVDKKKMPDIRLVALELPPTSIEIKWAHKWSLLNLERALTDQLVGQYLKAANSSHGMLLIVNADPAETWSKRGMKEKLSFQGLVSHLAALAQEVELTKVGVIRLEVVGIDCT